MLTVQLLVKHGRCQEAQSVPAHIGCLRFCGQLEGQPQARTDITSKRLRDRGLGMSLAEINSLLSVDSTLDSYALTSSSSIMFMTSKFLFEATLPHFICE